MAFTDLPDGWNLLPITHPALLADVLDLIVSARARRDGALCLLLCDDGERLLSPVEISPLSDVPRCVTQRADTLRDLLVAVSDGTDDLTLLAAIARPGGLSVTDDDIAWAEAVSHAADGLVRIIGVHVVTPDGSRPVPRVSRAA